VVGLALFGRDEFCTMPSNGERNVRNSEALRLVEADPPTFLFSYCRKFPPTMVGALEGKYPERKAVRDWLEKTLEEFSEQWPKAEKQARALQDDLVSPPQCESLDQIPK
jgi:hypothetical protein